MLVNLYSELDELQDIYELLEKSIVEDPPMTVKEGGIIKLRIWWRNWQIKISNNRREKLDNKLRSGRKRKNGNKKLKNRI